jgi:flavin reductase (DIM6/NTAB) family NADH-FMN oxidoreductase RutF
MERWKAKYNECAWGGIACSTPPALAFHFAKATLSYHNIMHSQAYTVNIPSENPSKKLIMSV